MWKFSSAGASTPRTAGYHGACVTHSTARLLVAAGLVWRGPGRILVQRRSPAARHGAGMYELPGGKVERGEAPAAALARELLEEWGAAAHRLQVGPIAEVLHHVYPAPGPEVVLLVYHVDGGGLVPAALELEAGVVVDEFAVEALPLDEFLAADRPFVARIRGRQLVAP